MAKDQNKGAAQAAKTDAATPPASSEDRPKKVRFVAPYGFYDDENHGHFWQPGDLVSDEALVADLIARGAPLEDVAE